MRLKTVFTIAAIVAFIMGLGTTLAPAMMLGSFGVDADSVSMHLTRALGGAVLAIAVMTWLARDSGPSKARDALVIGLSVFFALMAIEDARAILAGILNPTAWFSVVLSVVLLLLVIIAGRSARSQS